MAKDNVTEWDATASNNTVIADINIAESCPPSGINNAIREIMAQIKDVDAGTQALSRLKVDNVDINGATIGHTSDTDLLTLADGNLTVAGTVTTTGAIELGNASDTTVARSGAGDISVEGNAIYRAGGTDVPVADGGTGASTHTANAVLVGAGTSAITSISPSTSGNVLTSNGSTWSSAAPAGGGKMLQVVSATTTTSTQTSSTSYVDATNLTATITPSAATSKILILLSVSVFTDPDNRAVGEFKFVRTIGGTAADVSNSVFSGISHNARQNGNHFLMVLDSPSTTSAATYKVQFFKTDQSGYVEVNRNDFADICRSVITLIEVGA
tara:strand:- start:672 stop:1652 length:981 start_codon:yes stop_codon:yes gene_type:complete